MATITLYKEKVNGVGGLIDNLIKSSSNLDVQLGTLKNTLQGVDSSTCNLQDTVDSISSSSKSEKSKIDDLKKLNNKLSEFIETASRKDSAAEEEIKKSKEDFYTKYSYLKPECEKSVIEHICDGVQSVAEWCKEHWKLIVTIAIVIVSVAVLLIPGVGPIIAGACWGAILGACIGGVSGGLESIANGGSFLEGFEDGALSGAISGAIGGAAFAGLGQLGAVAGKGIKCMSGFGKFIKGTASVTKVMSTAMGGFDTIALVDKAFGNGDIATLNAKLHESKAYNIFQTGVTAVAVLTNGMTSTISCFVAGTLVMTAVGLVAIENIKVGDMVVSADPDTIEIHNKPVVDVFTREVDRLVHLTVNNEEIVTTFDHPFYVKGKGFINATNLWIGAELVNKDGCIIVVENIFKEYLKDRTAKVHNFKVEDFHTYFVGNIFIWVHNAECTIEFSNKSRLDEKEFKQQLKDQQDGLGDLTIDEYKNNRQAYNDRKLQTGSGRDPNSVKYQNQAKKKVIADKITEFRKQGYSKSESESMAKNWAKGKAALHGPDQIVGGKANNISGLGDSKINSSIGSQWKSRVGTLDSYINEKAATLPGSAKLSELDIEFVLK